MRCNRFVGETLIRVLWFSDESVVFAAAAMYQEHVPSYKHLDEPLDEGRFVFECILTGNFQAFTMCKPQLFHVQDTLDCTLHCTGNSVSCYKINCSFLVTCSKRLHSWYCTEFDQPKMNYSGLVLIRSTHKFSELNSLR